MRPRLAKLLRHPWRAAAAFALLTAAPKCVVCVSAYIGLGALLGVDEPELCGGPTDSPFAWTIVLAWLGFAVALGTAFLCVVCRRLIRARETRTTFPPWHRSQAHQSRPSHELPHPG